MFFLETFGAKQLGSIACTTGPLIGIGRERINRRTNLTNFHPGCNSATLSSYDHATKSEVGGVSPLWHRQPGNRVSCLCLRCVRACARARDATRDQCGITVCLCDCSALLLRPVRRVTVKLQWNHFFVKKYFKNEGLAAICPKNILFLKAIFQNYTFLNGFPHIFEKHFKQAVSASTLHKHFIKTLYTSTLPKHFTKALYTST